MSQTQTADDDVLPFDKSDLHEGMGRIERIVALAEYRDSPSRVTADGRCPHCGYDRGLLVGHTEIAYRTVSCRECDLTLVRRD